MENYRDNRVQLATKFKELGDENPYKTNTQFNAAFESETGITVMIDDIKIHFGRTWTKEQFIKKFACDKPTFKDSTYCTSASSPTTGIDPKLSCVKRHYDNKGREVTINSNGSLVIRTLTPSKVWIFSKNYYWSQYNTELKKKEFEGKWECTGDSSFGIISNNKQWLSSDSLGWVDIAEPTTEPPTDTSTGGGFTWKDVNLTIDDLKSGKTVSMGMRGSIVGEIQKLLIGKGYKEVSKSGQPDNMFGRMTKAQVEKFQLENKDDKGNQLKKDGIVGPKTINALLAPPPAPNTRGLERAVKSYLPTGVSSEL